MPANSQAQFRAMQAAKHGHSTLGIPQKVGAEFVDEMPSPKELPKRKGSPKAEAMRRHMQQK